MRFTKNIVTFAVAFACSNAAFAGTDTFFNPLTASSAVATPNHINEQNGPWVAPAGIAQQNLTSLSEIEADVSQSVSRAANLGTGASMFDMIAFDPEGEYLFIPHESRWGAGVTRYDIANDRAQLLFAGDGQGEFGDYSNDYGAFDPARFTPNGTVFLAEEWAGEGRVIEVMNPYADPADIEYRELESIANVAHEGIIFSKKFEDTIYFIDENNSGSIYKFVMKNEGDYTVGQTFVLSIDSFADMGGDAAANWNSGTNQDIRTGAATWVAMTDEVGNVLPGITNPFAAGSENGRQAADDANGTPYGRPEDTEVGTLRNGNEVLYVAATSEQTVYSIEMNDTDTATVRVFASEYSTPKNLGFPSTTGVINSPDNLAQDALGNIYIIEDAPNSSDVGGDIWFVRDTDSDGVAESVDHFLSLQVAGAEATGMIFNPAKPTQFVVSVQHPTSTDLNVVSNGYGDAVWSFDLSNVVPPSCEKKAHRGSWVRTCSHDNDFNFIKALERAADHERGHHRKKHWGWHR